LVLTKVEKMVVKTEKHLVEMIERLLVMTLVVMLANYSVEKKAVRSEMRTVVKWELLKAEL
jgi:hypothetical protein